MVCVKLQTSNKYPIKMGARNLKIYQIGLKWRTKSRDERFSALHSPILPKSLCGDAVDDGGFLAAGGLCGVRGHLCPCPELSCSSCNHGVVPGHWSDPACATSTTKPAPLNPIHPPSAPSPPSFTLLPLYSTSPCCLSHRLLHQDYLHRLLIFHRCMQESFSLAISVSDPWPATKHSGCFCGC